MPKIYHRCSICHNAKVSEYWCNFCNKVTKDYKCQANYWWELACLAIRDFVRNLRKK